MLSMAAWADQYQLTCVFDKLLTIIVLLASGLLAIHAMLLFLPISYEPACLSASLSVCLVAAGSTPSI